MKKILLSIILSSLSLWESQAISTKALGCKFHNSRKCVTPNHFIKERDMGCASVAGNCRYQFCKSNCINSPSDDVKALCKTECSYSALLSRFNSKDRRSFYNNFYLSNKGMTLENLKDRSAATSFERDIKDNRKWWRLKKYSKNSKLLRDDLLKEYAAFSEEYNKLTEAAKKAKASGQMEKAAALEKRASEIREEMTLIPLEVEEKTLIFQTAKQAVRVKPRVAPRPSPEAIRRSQELRNSRRASMSSLGGASAFMAPPPPPLPQPRSSALNMPANPESSGNWEKAEVKGNTPPSAVENKNSFTSTNAIPTHDTVRNDTRAQNGNLLAQIRAGKTLRSAAERPLSSEAPKAGGMGGAGGGAGLMGAIANNPKFQALSEQRETRQDPVEEEDWE
ncbi:MAG: hypothetical protein ACK5PQ_00400 [Alphaproteobacteria bacterium]